MSLPFLYKIQTLGRITPPLKPKSSHAPYPVRGSVIAVEGDNQNAVSSVTRWLEDFLRKADDYVVRTATGPDAPDTGREVSITDYFGTIGGWHSKGAEIERFITTPTSIPTNAEGPNSAKKPSVSEDDTNPADNDHDTDDGTRKMSLVSEADNNGVGTKSDRMDDTSPPTTPTPCRPSTTLAPAHAHSHKPKLPVLLIQNYQLAASNAWACRVPAGEAYNAKDHWQWIATLWRGIIGPDITVYVRDCAAEEIARARNVEVIEDARAVVVRREKEPGAVVEERNLRRLGFEISEWVRSVSYGTGERE